MDRLEMMQRLTTRQVTAREVRSQIRRGREVRPGAMRRMMVPALHRWFLSTIRQSARRRPRQAHLWCNCAYRRPLARWGTTNFPSCSYPIPLSQGESGRSRGRPQLGGAHHHERAIRQVQGNDKQRPQTPNAGVRTQHQSAGRRMGESSSPVSIASALTNVSALDYAAIRRIQEGLGVRRALHGMGFVQGRRPRSPLTPRRVEPSKPVGLHHQGSRLLDRHPSSVSAFRLSLGSAPQH